MNKDGNIAIARASYEAYVTKDRSAVEPLIADDLHFTSPLDNRISRTTYFERAGQTASGLRNSTLSTACPNPTAFS